VIQLELPWQQIEGHIGSRVRCKIDVADYRYRILTAHEREHGYMPGRYTAGPFPACGDQGTVKAIKSFTVLDRGCRVDEVPRVIVQFDSEVMPRFMPPFMLEVLP
jgi:hypothetical protein